jgi:hypothetical protein
MWSQHWESRIRFRQDDGPKERRTGKKLNFFLTTVFLTITTEKVFLDLHIQKEIN